MFSSRDNKNFILKILGLVLAIRNQKLSRINNNILPFKGLKEAELHQVHKIFRFHYFIKLSRFHRTCNYVNFLLSGNFKKIFS